MGAPSVENIINTMDERGFVVVPNVISTDHAYCVNEILKRLLDEERTPEERSAGTQRVGRIAVKNPVFLDLMCHQLVVEVWKRYLGDDVVCSTWTANTLYPGHGRIGWHADYPYWSITPPWPEGNLAGQTVWLLDDFSAENGATGAVPYSHRKGAPPDEPRDLWNPNGEILTGTRGSVVFAHGAWWHTARPNQTDQPRSCLLGMYMRPCVITQEDMRGQLDELDDPSELARQLMCENIYRPKDIGAEKERKSNGVAV
jgi:ectoine hydroxylase-related dioxygenase (phytanoyl-CoA dioxygenase family)